MASVSYGMGTKRNPCADREAPLRVNAIFIWQLLTYMATLEHLAAADKLLKHEPDLDESELSERIAYFSPGFDHWLDATLRQLAFRAGRDLTPFEQAEQILYEFVAGQPMAYSVHYRKLEPLMAHVWELKTPDVRLFGWFPKRAIIVLVCGTLKENVKKFGDYAPFIREVIAFRDALALDNPKAITGVGRHEVL